MPDAGPKGASDAGPGPRGLTYPARPSVGHPGGTNGLTPSGHGPAPSHLDGAEQSSLSSSAHGRAQQRLLAMNASKARSVEGHDQMTRLVVADVERRAEEAPGRGEEVRRSDHAPPSPRRGRRGRLLVGRSGLEPVAVATASSTAGSAMSRPSSNSSRRRWRATARRGRGRTRRPRRSAPARASRCAGTRPSGSRGTGPARPGPGSPRPPGGGGRIERLAVDELEGPGPYRSLTSFRPS